MKELHLRLVAATNELGKSLNFFMTKPNPQWTVAFLYSRNAFCNGLYALYELRDQLPIVADHFLLPGAKAPFATGFGWPARPDLSSASATTIAPITRSTFRRIIRPINHCR